MSFPLFNDSIREYCYPSVDVGFLKRELKAHMLGSVWWQMTGIQASYPQSMEVVSNHPSQTRRHAGQPREPGEDSLQCSQGDSGSRPWVFELLGYSFCFIFLKSLLWDLKNVPEQGHLTPGDTLPGSQQPSGPGPETTVASGASIKPSSDFLFTS